ncbi:hypothetical protein LH486_27710, partial [Klebsiella pneumoniae]|nr:hypothetical protein [Klebsiella pneumoniae]
MADIKASQFWNARCVGFSVDHFGYLHCFYVGLPRSWWEGSERHIQLSVVEHHPQFKALPVSVS